MSALKSVKETEPAEAYNIWAASYDGQDGNLMLDLDEEIVSHLIEKISFVGKVIADIGCGTGRHWKKFYEKQPLQLIGYDVSEGMLKVLKSKYPKAETYQLKDNHLPNLKDGSCDIIVSTLALAHIEDVMDALKEWNRVLKKGGSVILTDYHPDALAKGGNRTFAHNGKIVAVKNYVHSIDGIKEHTKELNWKIEELQEKKIDDTMRPYYEKKDALHVFERFKGTPIIYGMILIKN